MRTYPVIHHLSRELTLTEVRVAREAGADGVFLISHHGDDDELVHVAWEARSVFAGFPVGINLLSRTPEEAARTALAEGLPMVWADRMGVSSAGLTGEGERLARLRAEHPELEFFASVAFKYQAFEPRPRAAALQALHAGFIPTTSGTDTGRAPELEKIAAMSAATGGVLAVASGMTPENIASFAPHLSHCLVATGIGMDEHRIDAAKLRRFLQAAAA